VGVSSMDDDPQALLARVRQAPKMTGAALVDEVTAAQAYVVPAVGEKRYTVAALDLGIKRNTPRRLAQRGIETHVLPATASMEQLLAVRPDALFLSNGPGDPATAEHAVALTGEALRAGLPVFGICLGNQILGRTLGFGTYKLKFGHRGVNQPVLDRATGKVEVTAHNHGFAVGLPGHTPAGEEGAPAAGDDVAAGPEALVGVTAGGAPVRTPFGEVEVSHVCLNDGVIEGLRCRDARALSVQYHPEAAAGPHDADYLFDRFAELIEGRPAGAGHRPARIEGEHA